MKIEYERHPHATIPTPLSEPMFRALVESIRAHGLRDPITLRFTPSAIF